MQTVKTYFASRGLHPDPWPHDLRYHPSLSNFTTNRKHPAMIAAVRDVAGDVVAAHQTFLTPEGRKISGEDVKARLFLGAMKGGAIRLAPATDRVALCEGIEDALSIIQSTDWPCWATGSASNIPDLPETIKEVLLCPDNDPAGIRAAHKAAARYTAEGRKVRVALPPHGAKDWNEALQKEKATSAKAALYEENSDEKA